MIYLDHNATTPVDPGVLEAMLPYLRGGFGNPSSGYRVGREARRAVEGARGQVAAALGCEDGEIFFTSCGTESNNAVVWSAVELGCRHVVTCRSEHSAVLAPLRAEAGAGRIELTELGVDGLGRVDMGELEAALRPGETGLVSLMWANNETGVLHDVERMVELARGCGAMSHTDAVQAFGKVEVDVREVGVDMLSLSGHKFYAPKGVGVLYRRRGLRLAPGLLGGGQERGFRGGTENVAGIVAIGAAAELVAGDVSGVEGARLAGLRWKFEEGMRAIVPEMRISTGGAARLPNTSHLYLPGIDAAGLLLLGDERGLCVSAGSACHSGAVHPSHVLEAMGYGALEAGQCLRVSLGRNTTEGEIEAALEVLRWAVGRMRAARGGGPVLFAE